MELLDVTFHAVHELSIGGPKVGSAAAGGDGVVAIAGRRGPAMKIAV